MRAMHSEKYNQSSKHPKSPHGPCAVIINFPHQEQASTLEKDMKTSIPDSSLKKKFDLSRKGSELSIKIHEVQDVDFCGAFLLAVSASVKELVTAANEEHELSFNFTGADQAGAAVCLASHGLWPAQFNFSNSAEQERFNAARVDIDKQITEITKEATPIMKKELVKAGLLKEEDRKGKK